MRNRAVDKALTCERTKGRRAEVDFRVGKPAVKGEKTLPVLDTVPIDLALCAVENYSHSKYKNIRDKSLVRE